ncbi:MAG: HAD family hydrolase [bacterium]
MIELPDFDLYLFDLDDTLINTRQAYTSAQATTIRNAFPALTGNELAAGLKDLSWLCRIFGSGNPEGYFSAFLASRSDLQRNGKTTVSALTASYRSAFESNLEPLAGAESYLLGLANRKKRMALVSNGVTRSQFKKLQLSGLNAFFPESHCYVSESYHPTQKKPSPYMIHRACQETGIDSAQSVFFGNSPEDILAGNLAGVATVLVGENMELENDTPDIALPDYRMDSWMP